MLYNLDELHLRLCRRTAEVYDIFCDFFGSNCVDLWTDNRVILRALDSLNIAPNQEGRFDISDSIMETIGTEQYDCLDYVVVWWPSVVVTNENGDHEAIRDLYARIPVASDGRIPYQMNGFTLTRSSFDQNQWASGYVHSHVPPIGTQTTPDFLTPCLGRGPIKDTILSLKSEYSDIMWMLFCQELSLYVTVESLKGGPYIRMASIGDRTVAREFVEFNSLHLRLHYDTSRMSGGDKAEFTQLLNDFVSYYLEKGSLSFNYAGGRFVVGMSYYDYMVDISDSFIQFFNKNGTQHLKNLFYNKGFLASVTASNGRFYSGESDEDIFRNNGVHLFTFKGRDVSLVIHGAPNNRRAAVILLSNSIAMYVIQKILKIVNYYYHNEHNNKDYGDSTEERSSTTHRKACFLQDVCS